MNSSPENIYFMDFIKYHFKKPDQMDQLLKLFQRTIGEDKWEDIFNFLISSQYIKFVFDKYFLWDKDYKILGLRDREEFAEIHYAWQRLIKQKCQNDISFIKFKEKNLKKLKINFEGE